MDLRLYFRVVWRFRLMIATGLVLATALAFLSYVNVRFEDGGISARYRQHETWQSQATLFITQEGFPWGRARADYIVDPDGTTPPVPSADAARLSSLAVLYAELASGDPVKRLLPRPTTISTASNPAPAAIPGLVEVKVVPAPAMSSPPTLPLISIRAIETSPRRAVALAEKATQAVVSVIRNRQNAAAIAETDRVVVEVNDRADSARMIGGRGKTLPMVVFLSVMIAAIGLAFILENLRPITPKVAAAPSDGLRASPVSRAADSGRR